jgi:hypothetical protein
MFDPETVNDKGTYQGDWFRPVDGQIAPSGLFPLMTHRNWQ